MLRLVFITFIGTQIVLTDILIIVTISSEETGDCGRIVEVFVVWFLIVLYF